MRPLIIVFLLGAVLMVPALIIGDAVFARQADDRDAANRVGVMFAWPNALEAADPVETLRTLTEAADATGANVLRTTVSTDDSGRNHITHYIYMAATHTALFDGSALANGRWLSRDETRLGTATVSSERARKANNVGVPEIIANGYGLTFAPLSLLFDSWPSAGQYVVEAPNATDVDRFLSIVHQRLIATGVDALAVADLRVDPPNNTTHQSGRFAILPYALTCLSTVSVMVLLSREAKAIGVRRLLGHSVLRVWFGAIGRLQLASVAVGLIACAAVPVVVTGIDRDLLWTLIGASALLAAIGLAATLTVGMVIIRRISVADLIKGREQ